MVQSGVILLHLFIFKQTNKRNWTLIPICEYVHKSWELLLLPLNIRCIIQKKKDFWSGTENGFVYDKSKYIADTEEEWNSMWQNINGSTFSPQQLRGLNNRIELLTTIKSLCLIGRICNLIDPTIIRIVINFRLYLFIFL